MKSLPLLFVAGCASALACGPFFYPAPPTLDRYPERLPVKTMRELLRETHSPPADAATFDQLSEATRAIAGDLGAAPRDELLRRIDTALGRNRAGDYRKRFANCLYDFRDLLASKGTPAAEVSIYAAWRAQAMDWDDGFFEKPPQAESWQFTPAQIAEMRREWQQKLDETAARLAQEAAKAAPVLKPHWLVQAGAWQFKYARFDAAARFFQQAIDEAPRHPRAEVARLMLARVRAEEWRVAKRDAEERGETDGSKLSPKLQSAEKAFDAYLAAYPRGRFAPDIPGWQGGLAREDGDLQRAIILFLQQTDFVDHPEIVRRAVRECEACLNALDAAKFDDEAALNGGNSALPLDEIARRPLAALAVVYHFLDSESRQSFEELFAEGIEERDLIRETFVPMLRMRRAGREILPALAQAVAKQKENYGAVWRPKYLAVLAWAASESGEHTQAVRLCDVAGPALDGSDDLLFVRAVALQRAGELDEAIAAFRRLQEKFPQSPLSAETRFRIATALRDKHEAGLAVVEMMRIEMEQRARSEAPADQPPEPRASPELHLGSEIGQWIDTLLHFAPLAELERGVSARNLEAEIAARLRLILRSRHLAREDFAAARRFAEPATDEPIEAEQESIRPEELAGKIWRKTVNSLSKLTQEVDKTIPPEARAEKLFALAEAWSSARGRLTLPSMNDFGICNSDYYEVWTQRHRNARVAGYSSTAAADELEIRDELRHAFRFYLQAAEGAPGTPLAARALWRANDALRRMAELSPWSSARAFETNASALSRQLHERLLQECPASVEAKRLSVWWSFPPAAELRWMPCDLPDYDVEVAIADAFEGRPGEIYYSPQWEWNEEFKKRLEKVAANAGTWDTAKLLDELAAIRRDFLPAYVSPRGSWVINHLDDLTLFLHEPGLTPSVRSKYFAARLGDGPPDPSDPEMQPWRDYLTFLALVREKPIAEDPTTGEQRFRPISDRMREFLKKFPQSRKREAALARLAIAIVRETHVHAGVVSTSWPEAPKLGGYKAIAVKRGQRFDTKRVFAGLDAYEREFPNGRYAAEIRLWRGAASIDAGEWKTAVDLLTATLDDKTKRDLHLDAALNLADVFMRLLDQPNLRPEIIAALRGSPAAQARLHQFMHSNTLGARLRCMEDYLEQCFGASGGER